MAPHRVKDDVRKRIHAGSAVRDHVADDHDHREDGRVNSHDALAYGSGRQHGRGHRLGPGFFLRNTVFEMCLPNWLYLATLALLSGTIVIFVVLLAAPIFARYGIHKHHNLHHPTHSTPTINKMNQDYATNPSIDVDACKGVPLTCPRPKQQQQEQQQPPDDPLLAELIEQACMLHQRVGVFRDVGSYGEMEVMTTAFSSENEAQLRWADLDLGEAVEFFVHDYHEDDTEDKNGGRQHAKDPSALIASWEWASKMACWGCLKKEKQQPHQDRKHQTSPPPTSQEGKGKRRSSNNNKVKEHTLSEGQHNRPASNTSQSFTRSSRSTLPQGLLEALVAYIRNPVSWGVYLQYFGRLYADAPGAGGVYAAVQRQERSRRIRDQCAACCWKEEEEEKEDQI